MKKYKIEITPALRLKLRRWWAIYHTIEDEYWQAIEETEKKMEKDTGIKGIEFFISGGECLGVGNGEKTMPLVQLD